jgi:RNA recognition motif-containing protein
LLKCASILAHHLTPPNIVSDFKMLSAATKLAKEESSRESLLGRQLFVGNLPYNVGWQDIKDLFREAGNVTRVNVMTNKDGTSKGHAIVLFGTAKEAQFAIKYFANYKWQGRILDVKEDKSLYSINQKFETETTLAGDDFRQVFVSNIPFIVGWQDLKDLFREAGNVVRADIRIDPKTGKSRGHGTVLFSNGKEAERALMLFDGFEWFGRKIDVKPDKGFRDKQLQLLSSPPRQVGGSDSLSVTSAASKPEQMLLSEDEDFHLSHGLHAEEDEVFYRPPQQSYGSSSLTANSGGRLTWADRASLSLGSLQSSLVKKTPPRPIAIPSNSSSSSFLNRLHSELASSSNISFSAPENQLLPQQQPMMTGSPSLFNYGSSYYQSKSNPFTLPLSMQSPPGLARNLTDTLGGSGEASAETERNPWFPAGEKGNQPISSLQHAQDKQKESRPQIHSRFNVN